MTCKNCGHKLEHDASFCDKCGAKVVKNRITFKLLLSELFASFGLDSLYANTLRKMFSKPHEVLKDYLDGARKKYVNPFAYLAVGAALSLIVFNFYSKEFIDVNNSFNQNRTETLKEKANIDLSKLTHLSEKEIAKLKRQQQEAELALKLGDTYYDIFVRYFNIISFLFLPFYAFISYMTFRKPNNYGEHIIINSYIQGTTMYISIVFFLVAMLISPKIYPFGTIGFIAYYLYTFGKMYDLTTKQYILKFLRFCVVSLITILIIAIFITVISYAIGFFTGYKNPEILK
ncbi:DUF3667 domain-containing protein [Tenacibaculum sp. 190524A05c]|uniref:DUF3667 domain-containing protein n=1 Tax=Tenacibaculum platacis TaxID=3137852 RepID=UPI0032B1FEF4